MMGTAVAGLTSAEVESRSRLIFVRYTTLRAEQRQRRRPIVVEVFENPLGVVVCKFDRVFSDGLPLIVEDVVSQDANVFVGTFLPTFRDNSVYCRSLDLLLEVTNLLVTVRTH